MSGLRIGVLGGLRIAESAIVAPAADLGHRLVAVAARDPRRAAGFAQKYGVERVVDSYQEVIGDPEVDVVYNPLANSLHAPWNLAAVAAGKPVLTEKPFASNRNRGLAGRSGGRRRGRHGAGGFPLSLPPGHPAGPSVTRGRHLGRFSRVEVVMQMPGPRRR